MSTQEERRESKRLAEWPKGQAWPTWAMEAAAEQVDPATDPEAHERTAMNLYHASQVATGIAAAALAEDVDFRLIPAHLLERWELSSFAVRLTQSTLEQVAQDLEAIESGDQAEPIPALSVVR